LEKMQQFGAILKIFGRAVFEAIEVKGRLMLNFAQILRLRPRNFSIIPESLAANLKKVRQTSV
jgi:hypothetical protein